MKLGYKKSVLVKLCVISAATSLLLIVGCSKSGEESKGDASAASVSTSSAAGVGGALPVEPTKASSADKSTSLDKFVLFSVRDDDRHFAMLYYALKGVSASDEEVLNVLSGDYYNERDAFKKQEIKAQEASRIASELDQHKKMRYVSFEAGEDYFYGLRLGGYDFAKKGFPLSMGGMQSGCLRSDIKIGSGFVLRFRDTAAHCFANVEDVELAKKIESNLANNKGRITHKSEI